MRGEGEGRALQTAQHRENLEVRQIYSLVEAKTNTLHNQPTDVLVLRLGARIEVLLDMGRVVGRIEGEGAGADLKRGQFGQVYSSASLLWCTLKFGTRTLVETVLAHIECCELWQIYPSNRWAENTFQNRVGGIKRILLHSDGLERGIVHNFTLPIVME